jgi:hypothetical protein
MSFKSPWFPWNSHGLEGICLQRSLNFPARNHAGLVGHIFGRQAGTNTGRPRGTNFGPPGRRNLWPVSLSFSPEAHLWMKFKGHMPSTLQNNPQEWLDRSSLRSSYTHVILIRVVKRRLGSEDFPTAGIQQGHSGQEWQTRCDNLLAKIHCANRLMFWDCMPIEHLL